MKTKPVVAPTEPVVVSQFRPVVKSTQSSSVKHDIKVVELAGDNSIRYELGTAGVADTALAKAIKSLGDGQTIAFLGKDGSENRVDGYFSLTFAELKAKGSIKPVLVELYGDKAESKWNQIRNDGVPANVLKGTWGGALVDVVCSIFTLAAFSFMFLGIAYMF